MDRYVEQHWLSGICSSVECGHARLGGGINFDSSYMYREIGSGYLTAEGRKHQNSMCKAIPTRFLCFSDMFNSSPKILTRVVGLERIKSVRNLINNI